MINFLLNHLEFAVGDGWLWAEAASSLILISASPTPARALSATESTFWVFALFLITGQPENICAMALRNCQPAESSPARFIFNRSQSLHRNFDSFFGTNRATLRDQAGV